VVEFQWRGLTFRPRAPGDDNVFVSGDWRVYRQNYSANTWCASWSSIYDSIATPYAHPDDGVCRLGALEELRESLEQRHIPRCKSRIAKFEEALEQTQK
jgi:hypothetical protein